MLRSGALRAACALVLAAEPAAAARAQTGPGEAEPSAVGDTTRDLVYTPVTPCRIVDTRLAEGGILSPGVAQAFKATDATTDFTSQGGSATGCGVPSGATAIAVNFGATQSAGAGNLRAYAWDAAATAPNASVLNFGNLAPAGLVTVPNASVVPICDPAAITCANDLWLKAYGSATHLVVDVLGYFRAVAMGSVRSGLLADGAVTWGKIASGTVVRSLNGGTDVLTLAGANGLEVGGGPTTLTVTSNATSANTPGTIVARDGSGHFSAGTVALSGSLMLPATTSTAGAIRLGGNPFLHGFGAENTFVGTNAGNTGTTGKQNSALGYGALQGNASDSNTALGAETLFVNSTGWGNTAAGFQALYSNEGGYYNTAVGMDALSRNAGGANNTAVGRDALLSNTTGSRNTAIGWQAGANATTGDDNIFVGSPGVAGDTHTIHIGTYNYQTSFFAEGIYQSSIGDRQVFINSAGQLGTLVSSRAYKDEIRDMGDASDGLMRLRPVSFHYKQAEPSGEHPLQFGLIAEEVAEVYPDLVARSEAGEPRTVRYHLLDPMLLNELQKQHRQLDEQRTENERLQALVRDLEARLRRLEAAIAGGGR